MVVEEFLDGEEASFFCICDGKTALPLGSAQDHKRVGDGDTGPNTGGMGAYAPAPVMTPEIVERTMRELIEPTMRGMAEIGAPFSGILFLGLMIGKDGPKLIEYNTRFGDPECQVLMMRLNSDLLALINAAVDGKLDEVSLDWKDQPALTVVMAAEGYPSNVKKGSVIRDLDKLEGIDGVKVFHAGTAEKNGSIVASGGRVLNITAIAETVAEAQARAYEAVKFIDWSEGFTAPISAGAPWSVRSNPDLASWLDCHDINSSHSANPSSLRRRVVLDGRATSHHDDVHRKH